MPDKSSWCPFRPGEQELENLASEVDTIKEIQTALRDKHPDLQLCDRVAHQYQIAGSRVRLDIRDDIPEEIQGIGPFVPGSQHFGVGRISTGLGTPHIETNPDFLGLMLAFATREGQRVDLLAINHPASPTDNHRDFIHVLHATEEAAGEEMPLIGDWGEYDAGNLLAEQKAFAMELKARMGWVKAGKTLAHIIKQTFRTFNSASAYQSYWTGVLELGETAGKFTLVPTEEVNHRPGFRPGQYYLSEEWHERQAGGDIAFRLYWVPYLHEGVTSLLELTEPWAEAHKQQLGTVTFLQTGVNAEFDTLYSILAMEMGANPGNWVHNRENSIRIPATEFTAARQLAYQKSQEGRDALKPSLYQSVFKDGQFSQELRDELYKRHAEKVRLGHINQAFLQSESGGGTAV